LQIERLRKQNIRQVSQTLDTEKLEVEEAKKFLQIRKEHNGDVIL
jgi:hypothetical protein